jgi:hypothetical protein
MKCLFIERPGVKIDLSRESIASGHKLQVQSPEQTPMTEREIRDIA